MKLLFLTALAFAQAPPADLFDAVRAGDLAQVKALLDKGAGVNAKGPYGQTPLFFAADRGHMEVVRLLVGRGAAINVTETFYGMTPLSRALMKKRYEVAGFLLEKGAEGAGSLAAQAGASGDAALAKMVTGSGKATAAELATALELAKRGKHEAVAALLAEAGAGALPPATFTVPPEILSTYTGTYTGGRGGTEFDIEIAAEGGRLKATYPSRPNPQMLAAVSTTEFRDDATLQSIVFRVENGTVTGFLVKPFANQFFRRKK